MFLEENNFHGIGFQCYWESVVVCSTWWIHNETFQQASIFNPCSNGVVFL